MASVAITEPTKEDIDLENGSAKRYRDEAEEENGVAAKKQKSVEEVRMEGGEEEAVKEEGKAEEGEVKVGPKTFGSSVEMFDYFYKLLHNWPTNISFNKYEHLVLLELINKGHPEPEKKVGSGIIAFEIRQHPEWKSRCFFVLRADESVEDFSFRKCVDHILPLPENMKIKSDVNKALGGGGKGGGRGRGRGWGRGGGGGKFRR